MTVQPLRTFAESLASFAFIDLFNAKARKGFRKGTQLHTLTPVSAVLVMVSLGGTRILARDFMGGDARATSSN